MKQIFLACVTWLLLASCSLNPASEPPRIDATSKETAEASYAVMMKSLSKTNKQKLAIAVLLLNMDGIQSAVEILDKPELMNPSVVGIKDKVAGMTAEQIIELGTRVSSVQVELSPQ